MEGCEVEGPAAAAEACGAPDGPAVAAEGAAIAAVAAGGVATVADVAAASGPSSRDAKGPGASGLWPAAACCKAWQRVVSVCQERVL